MRWLAFVLLLLVTLASCGTSVSELVIETATDDVLFTVEIADSLDEQALGLMYREEMADNHGMLFVFEGEEYRTFWMKNTLLSLDMIFIDANGVIVDIIVDVAPCESDPCEKYTSAAQAQYVLEINAGVSALRDIVVGDTVVLP